MSFLLKTYAAGFTISTIWAAHIAFDQGGYGMFTEPKNLSNNEKRVVRPLLCIASGATDSLVWPVLLPVMVMDWMDKK